MTISYNYDVSSASITNFFKIALRWKGSIYKNVKWGLTIWLICYFFVSIFYRYIFNNFYKQKFNEVAVYVDKNLNNIPLQLLLGFFVSVVIDRWKQTFYNMGYIETVALTVSANLWGKDEESRLQRRTIIRYLVLHQILVFRDVSITVRRRFPNLESLVTAGFAFQSEVKYLESLEFDYQRYWVPLNWAINIVRRADSQKKFDTSSFMNSIIVEICKFRTSISQLCIYDWVPIPLKYIQVVSLAVNIYFILCLISRQYLLLNGPESDLFDVYFPFMTALQFVFLFGWLQVAVNMLNPLGDGDDDFECNFLIDKNIATGLAIVDKSHYQPPMETDIFFEDGFKPMYTPESAALLGSGLFGSVSTVNLAQPDEPTPMVEVVPINRSTRRSDQTVRERVFSLTTKRRNIFKSYEIRDINLASTLPVNINLNPDRPSTRVSLSRNNTDGFNSAFKSVPSARIRCLFWELIPWLSAGSRSCSKQMESADRKRRRRKYSLASDITEENPFSCYELSLFAAVYLACVLFLIIAYEKLMPVFNNPTYPFYNHVFDYRYYPKNDTVE